MSQDQPLDSGSSSTFHEADYQELLQSLQHLGSLTFPYRCPQCGKSYENLTELVRATQGPHQASGAGQASAGMAGNETQLLRQCVCGGEVRLTFENRRDTSPEGLRRRETFGQLLERLKAAGLPAEEARQELLKVLRGEPTPVLMKLLQH